MKSHFTLMIETWRKLSAREGLGVRVVGAAFAVLMLGGASNSASLQITVAQLRNDRGLVRICLSSHPRIFLRCESDGNARKLSVPVNQAADVRIDDLVPGTYALSVIHDENANGELDKFLFIPKEGFCFSRNPPVRMGPPDFDEVEFSIAGGASQQTVTIRYLL
jgi:uncharacterized protein (DUF2141 family)